MDDKVVGFKDEEAGELVEPEGAVDARGRGGDLDGGFGGDGGGGVGGGGVGVVGVEGFEVFLELKWGVKLGIVSFCIGLRRGVGIPRSEG